MFAFLGLDLDEWVGIALLLQTVLLAMSAWFVRWQLKQARDAQAEQSRPYVIVDFQQKGGLLNLIVENIGQTPAFDLRVIFEPELTLPEGASDDDRHQVEGFVRRLAGDGIPFMPPRRVHRFRYALAHVIKEGGYTTNTTAQVEYNREAGDKRRYNDSYAIDLGGIWHASFEHDIEESAQSISESVTKIANKAPTPQ